MVVIAHDGVAIEIGGETLASSNYTALGPQPSTLEVKPAGWVTSAHPCAAHAPRDTVIDSTIYGVDEMSMRIGHVRAKRRRSAINALSGSTPTNVSPVRLMFPLAPTETG